MELELGDCATPDATIPDDQGGLAAVQIPAAIREAYTAVVLQKHVCPFLCVKLAISRAHTGMDIGTFRKKRPCTRNGSE